MEITTITNLAALPHTPMITRNSALCPTLEAAAAKYRDMTEREPGRAWEYTQVTPIGGSRVTTWFFEWQMLKEQTI